jgi:crotonobetainyl-CoA:carnitine CoA-transferase CaiB-like acyl-CoA transferase
LTSIDVAPTLDRVNETQPWSAPARERLPLRGVKVIDLATLGAGPWLATRLADFGADVVKVERPGAGDPLRQLGHSDGDVPLWWKAGGRNKRCITVDLKADEGQEIVRRLAADADVLVENFRPGTLERWELDYETLSVGNPGLIMVRVTGWGQDGPYRDRAGFGTLAEAISGWAYLNGFPENPPTLPPFALGDAVTALLGSFATMVALYERDVEDGGRGQMIDLAIYESLFSLIGQQVILHDRLGVVPKRFGNSVDYAAPRNVYETRDGQYVTVVASTQGTWALVAEALGRPELIDDPRFDDNSARVRHREELDAIIGDWMAARSQADAMEAFEKHGAPAAPVYDIAQIFEDAHFRAREAIVSVDDEELGLTRVCGVFPRLSRTPGQIRHLAPAAPGANTDEVLLELGYSEDEVDELRNRAVV